MENYIIAHCGLICNFCYAFQRKINKCPGCTVEEKGKLKHCENCRFKICLDRKQTVNGICFECKDFPCQPLKQFDKRYRTKYGISIIENLRVIGNNGTNEFLKFESEKWKCKQCGENLCMHSNECPKCGIQNPHYIKT